MRPMDRYNCRILVNYVGDTKAVNEEKLGVNAEHGALTSRSVAISVSKTTRDHFIQKKALRKSHP